MNEHDLVRKIQYLKEIKPNQDWAVSARANLVRILDSDTKLSTPSVARGFLQSRGFSINWLTNPLPKPAFAVASVMLVVFSVFFAGTLIDDGADKVAFEAVSTESAVVVEASDDTAVKPAVKRTYTQSNFVQTFTSIRSYDSSDTFRTSLRERLDNVISAGLESNNESALSVAEEADELFRSGDYDGALRSIMAAESLLNL